MCIYVTFLSFLPTNARPWTRPGVMKSSNPSADLLADLISLGEGEKMFFERTSDIESEGCREVLESLLVECRLQAAKKGSLTDIEQ